ncbi:hypothetical protein COM13_07875 [Bacillus pseudomycoides]|uniref:PadR family transcriptional regulator n=1 Tax=Bacillus pseudomycoides TaxID=64104 RepID=A0ABD6T4U6_9BACI|nr:hypothetical protein BLX05_04075 [Bacillus pseudomycoides]PFE06069.1 hypothetical protein CN288_03420 [Bacillus sp. AFS023182]PGY04671.1 hypothetical protein COE15_03430 [Bacillus cereus]PDY00722.1 hypothetical protein COO07_08625 [Bacillus pseudomycoides]PDY12372.1 hypothetical protein COO16_09255 [Bacillus pseudomycoides]
MKKNVGSLEVFYMISEKLHKNECFWRKGEEGIK